MSSPPLTTPSEPTSWENMFNLPEQEELEKTPAEKIAKHHRFVLVGTETFHPSYYEIGAAACTFYLAISMWVITCLPLVNTEAIALLAYLALLNTVLCKFIAGYAVTRWYIWRLPVRIKALQRSKVPARALDPDVALTQWSLQRSEAFSMISP